jgi:ABC-2 type transport system ATP-binding protein
LIKVQQLKKRFGERLAVDNVEFQIEKGETFGFLGPNGAGKTTTIGMLVGILAPDEGHIEIAGGNPSTRQIRMRIGFAPQSLSLYDHLTAEENLRFFGSLYQLSGRTLRERVARALELAGLTDRSKDKVQTYSGGMKRRLNIAVAVLHEPQVLMLDEPTVGVDPQSRNHILETIGKLAAEGLTIVYTTHYMEEVEKLCRRIAIMDHGRILANETKEQLLARFGGEAKVRLELSNCPPTAQLPAIPRDGLLEFRSARPFDDLAELHRQGVEFSEIHIGKPDLESVFLNLTGRTLRD